MAKRVKAECTMTLGPATVTSSEVEVGVLDQEEDGNIFLEISVEDDKARKASLITSTNALKTILEAVEPGWEQLLKKATQELDETEKAKLRAELEDSLREHGYDEAAIKRILKLYGVK